MYEYRRALSHWLSWKSGLWTAHQEAVSPWKSRGWHRAHRREVWGRVDRILESGGEQNKADNSSRARVFYIYFFYHNLRWRNSNSDPWFGLIGCSRGGTVATVASRCPPCRFGQSGSIGTQTVGHWSHCDSGSHWSEMKKNKKGLLFFSSTTVMW